MIVINGRAKMLQIMHDGVAGILGQGKPGFTSPLANDAETSLRPVDVLDAQVPNLSRAQTKPSQEENDGPIP